MSAPANAFSVPSLFMTIGPIPVTSAVLQQGRRNGEQFSFESRAATDRQPSCVFSFFAVAQHTWTRTGLFLSLIEVHAPLEHICTRRLYSPLQIGFAFERTALCMTT